MALVHLDRLRPEHRSVQSRQSVAIVFHRLDTIPILGRPDNGPDTHLAVLSGSRQIFPVVGEDQRPDGLAGAAMAMGGGLLALFLRHRRNASAFELLRDKHPAERLVLLVVDPHAEVLGGARESRKEADRLRGGIGIHAGGIRLGDIILVQKLVLLLPWDDATQEGDTFSVREREVSRFWSTSSNDMQLSTVRGTSDSLTENNTHFFSLVGLCCDTASARADPWSTRLAWSAPPASAS